MITDQGGILRRAIYERLCAATTEDVTFDLGFGFVPDERQELVLGYTIVFKVRSPIIGEPVLAHPCVLIGHTPDAGQVQAAVNSAVADLTEKAAQQLVIPQGGRPR